MIYTETFDSRARDRARGVLRARAAAQCPCKQEKRRNGHIVGVNCWAALPFELRTKWNGVRALKFDDTKRLGVAREIYRFAYLRRATIQKATNPTVTAATQ
jgi:hypothetical protein